MVITRCEETWSPTQIDKVLDDEANVMAGISSFEVNWVNKLGFLKKVAFQKHNLSISFKAATEK